MTPARREAARPARSPALSPAAARDREEAETRRQAERIAALLGLDVTAVHHARAAIGGHRLDKSWPLWAALLRLADGTPETDPLEDALVAVDAARAALHRAMRRDHH